MAQILKSADRAGRAGAGWDERLIALLAQLIGDLLTDSFRAQLLRLVGYRVEVIEFIGGEHTPRNLMIRAVKTDAKPEQIDVDRYLEITAQWGVKPALEKKLSTLNIR